MPFVPSFVGSSKSTHKKRKSCHFDVIVGAMRLVLKYRLADFCPNNARVAAHFRAAKLVIRDCHPQSFAVCNCKKIRKYLYPQRFISPIAQMFDSHGIRRFCFFFLVRKCLKPKTGIKHTIKNVMFSVCGSEISFE